MLHFSRHYFLLFCNRNGDEIQSVYFRLGNSRAVKEKVNAVIYVSTSGSFSVLQIGVITK